MSIVYKEHGYNLHREISNLGYSLIQIDGVWISSNDAEVQKIIDNYDPLPVAKKENVNLVNKAAGEARTRYVTDIPFQEGAYQMKEVDVRQYKADGYPDDLTMYPHTAAESSATGLSPKDAADAIILQADKWILLSCEIERLRRKAIVEINSVVELSQVYQISEDCIKELEAI